MSSGSSLRSHRLRFDPGGDRPQQPPALAEAEADLAKVGVGQLAEDVDTDVMRRQRLEELLEAHLREPPVQLSHAPPPELNRFGDLSAED